jgi:hypothetical protein
MNRLLLASAAFLALSSPSWAVTQITVTDLGSIFNDSISFPSEHTPGNNGQFEDFFEFTLPVAEVVTLSMSDSGQGNQKIVGGILSLSTWTGTGATSPFIPTGVLIDSSPITNFNGGQSATTGPDEEAAGKYFALIEGKSGAAALKIAIDGNATAVLGAPETSTWTMMFLGFAGLAYAGMRSKKNSVSLIS